MVYIAYGLRTLLISAEHLIGKGNGIVQGMRTESRRRTNAGEEQQQQQERGSKERVQIRSGRPLDLRNVTGPYCDWTTILRNRRLFNGDARSRQIFTNGNSRLKHSSSSQALKVTSNQIGQLETTSNIFCPNLAFKCQVWPKKYLKWF